MDGHDLERERIPRLNVRDPDLCYILIYRLNIIRLRMGRPPSPSPTLSSGFVSRDFELRQVNKSKISQ